jgi:hypothetical protein
MSVGGDFAIKILKFKCSDMHDSVKVNLRKNDLERRARCVQIDENVYSQ